MADLTLVEDISGHIDKARKEPLRIDQLKCGRRHCICTFEYGAFFIWGDNEQGQLGDKKRRFLESPFPKAKFEKYYNVENVVCDHDSCAVIVERRHQVKKEEKQIETVSSDGSAEESKEPKKRKKKKRVITKGEVMTPKEMDAASLNVVKEDGMGLRQRIHGYWESINRKWRVRVAEREQRNQEQEASGLESKSEPEGSVPKSSS